MANVLILREREDGERTAASLSERGHVPLILPMEATRRLEAPPPPGAFAGFALTSARAVPALAEHFSGDPRPVFCVGERTAAAARAVGFPSVRTGEGTAADLAALATDAGLDGERGLLYAAGRRRTGTLERSLEAAGIRHVVWEVYETVAARPDAATVASLLEGRRPDVALLLSAGQAEAFAWLAERHAGFLNPPPRLLALSPRIAAALPPELASAAEISPTPRLSSLFERIG
ncbi:uroporphyrinogen-III synthase [Aurantimonas sp. VKM B-3413]|uniref:uroporphyrinogen-III synthase n=1 Tax=Aurantimonas sp. VKM B-3413 TaxID=2779401 RepID=UPI001E406700|nr:uroporphyrinogen-III synthase [Aurantimonas sp. VKM B-3413]MCB8837736.1 uroporphyrinogen-III synthase [Aurantimonas sp. VKM B-3413]